MNHFTYLIIGNSAAGIGAVESIRAVDPEGSMAIVSDEPYRVYSRPRISDRLTKSAGADTIAYRPADFYEKHSVTPILGVRAVALDAGKKTVKLENGEVLGYGKLLLSTGANPSRPPIPGIDLRGVHFFTTLDHAERLAGELGEMRDAVVIGGGLIGLQAAEALCWCGVKVTVVEMLDRVLPLALNAHGADLVRKKFQENGVTILTNSCVKEILGGPEGRVTGVLLVEGAHIPCQAVVMAVGVTPRAELAREAGVTVNKGIQVDDVMRTSAEDVYAAGDVAETRDLLSGKSRLIPIWPNAYMEGRTAGSAMAGKPVPYAGGLSMNSAHFFEFPVISAGTTEHMNGNRELVEANDRTGYYRRIVLKDNVPVGMVMAGDAVDRAGLVLSLIRNKRDVSSFVDQLASPDFGNAHLPDELRKKKQAGND